MFWWRGMMLGVIDVKKLRYLTLAAGILFFFASPKKNQKKSPVKDYTPFTGSSSVHLLYYCKLNSSFSMLSLDRWILFGWKPDQDKTAIRLTKWIGRRSSVVGGRGYQYMLVHRELRFSFSMLSQDRLMLFDWKPDQEKAASRLTKWIGRRSSAVAGRSRFKFK